MMNSPKVAFRRRNGGVLLRLLSLVLLVGSIAYCVTAPVAKNFLLGLLHEATALQGPDQKKSPAPELNPVESGTVQESTSAPNTQTPQSAESVPQPTATPDNAQGAEEAAKAESTPVPAAPTINLSDIAGQPDKWPKTVVLKKDVVFPINSGGKQVGEVTFHAGKELRLQGIEGQNVSLEYMGNLASVPADSTDIQERLAPLLPEANSGQTATAPASPAPALVLEPTPEPTPEVAQNAPAQKMDAVETPLFSWLKNNLVALRGSGIEPCGREVLAGVRYLVLYFAEGSDGATRRLTPQLIERYRQKKQKGVPLEFIFVSQDTRKEAMDMFMRESQLPWPALTWEQTNLQNDLTFFAGGQKPSLVLIDSNGRLLASSNKNGKYMGPVPVLEAMDRLPK